ncbi:polysaccharide deacetylase family protein [Reinekea marinisedimentorum]|uniref:Peptidoglycan/xylan/chitin deacetylase (PgdA/CDA1 family) n=1 Tax=Reinekea marinisedimentorum TaxID=230495 RepID=A0A4R3I9F3_9GAMM|nr:polysaccharide deacetylase family protein [Reinekea marinisedimentorum]TCS43019.1 peptidoglycan/xylan/chitin deacetylase (PgdA/CDA1 family) [Reinekea marinisedimentorum]
MNIRKQFEGLLLSFVIIVSSASAQLFQPFNYRDIVSYHQKMIFLMSGESTNEVARQRDTFIARNFYYEKRHRLEHLEAQLLKLPASERARHLNELFAYIYSDEFRAADALAFIDLVDNLLIEHSETPYLSQIEVRQLRQLEQQMLVIQDTYKEDLSEIYSAIGTRGLQLEPWQDYIDFLNQQYDRNRIYEQFNENGAVLNEPAVRGAEDNKNSNLVWGYGIPEKTVVLTFDDGPHYRNTGAILDTLKEYGVKGYFFAVGQNVGEVNGDQVKLSKKSEQLQRALREGHQLANHSFSHALLTKLEADEQKSELLKTSQALKAVSGVDTELFRPPYGSKNDALLKVSGELGMRAIMWNIDSKDWADPIPDSIVSRVMTELESKKKGILLFHDIHKQTVQALPTLLAELKKEGYKVVTIDGTPFGSEPEQKPDSVKPSVAVKSELYGNSWALVIGINKYRYWPQLSYAVNDAKGVEDILRQQYGFEDNHIFTLYDEDANRENITEHLANILSDPNKVKPNDRVFVFYAGHGMTRVLPSGRNLGYIIPFDAELDKFHSKSISMTHLQDFSDMIPAKHVYFVMDSCYSGIALTRSGGQQVRSKYLEEISSRQARQILTAGGADQEVADGGPGGHSVFTWSLLKGLSGEADLDENNIITASELGAFVSPLVAENSNQTPAFGNLVGSEGGEFLFELAPVHLSDAALTDEEKLKAAILELQKENAVLKQKLNELSDTKIAREIQNELDNEIRGLSLSERIEKANQYHAQGLAKYRNKEYQQSLELLHIAMTYNPSNPGIVNDYGFVLYRDGQFSEALNWLEKTIELDAERTPVYLNIADTLVELNRPDEAKPYYEYYLELYPESPVKERIDQFLSSES